MRLSVAALLLLSCGEPRPVTIFAASSLRELMTDVAPGARIQFEASSTLARQIRAGAPADLFITADPDWLQAPLDRYDWVRNRLVWVGARSPETLALALEQTPLGKYSVQAMRDAKIEPPARIVYGSNAKDVLSKVSHRGAEAAIVFATDAALDPSLPIVRTFETPRVVYVAALLTERGRETFERLRRPDILERARRRGFE